ncbi:MAG: glycosyltransferase [Gammaproteobacteria bacterium]
MNKKFHIKDIIRVSKLPFKFVYLLGCFIFFVLSVIFLIAIKKRRNKNIKCTNKVICVSHVAISFDGRIKKSANQIVNQGWDVTLLKPFDVQEDLLLERSGLDERIKLQSIGLSGVFSHFPYAFDIGMFLKMLFSTASYLHCHDVPTALMGLVVSQLTGKILVCDLHEWKSQTTTLTNKKINIIEEKIYQFIEEQVLKKSDFIITVNETIAEEIKNFYKVSKEILIVKNIPDFIELQPYNLREKLNIRSDYIILYYIGQLAPYRNIDNILYAIAKCEKVVFVIQGTIHEVYLNCLKELCRSLNICDKVHFLPPVPHDFIPSACQGADIGIFACRAIEKSMHYSLPNKLFEYIIGEIPIISEDLPVVRPYILENDIGFLINSNNPETISNALNVYVNKKYKLKIHKKNIITFKEKLLHDKNNYFAYSLIYGQNLQ